MRYTGVAIAVVLLLAGACSSHKQQAVALSGFDSGERTLIMKGAPDSPMRVLQITSHDDSLVLRSKSKNLPPGISPAVLRRLINRMYATVTDSATRGVGIAAPQVGVLKRIIWVQRLDKENQPFEVYFNPEITEFSEAKQDVPEGCLSVPDYWAVTTDRSYAVTVRYLDSTWTQHQETVEGFTAAIFQHETDHLDGTLFIDHEKKELESGTRNEKQPDN